MAVFGAGGDSVCRHGMDDGTLYGAGKSGAILSGIYMGGDNNFPALFLHSFCGGLCSELYFWGALSLLLVTLLFNRCEAWWNRAAVVMLVAVVGWWHEGFALSIVAGLMGWAVLKRWRVPLVVYVASVVLTLVALSVALCPGMMARIATREAGNSALLHDAVKVGVHNCLTVAMLVIVLGGLSLPRYRKPTLEMLRDSRICFFIVAAMGGLLLSIVTAYSARTAYWPQVCSMVVLGMWSYSAVRVRAKGVFVWIIALLSTAQGAVAVTWCYRLDRQHDKAMELVEASRYNTAFCDVTYPEDVPWYCFRMPAAIEWVEQFNYRAWNDRYFKLKKSLAVVPSALNRDLTMCDADTVGMDPVVKRVGDALIAERIETEYGAENVTCNITLNDGTRMDGTMALVLDFCDSEGHPFSYIKPFGLRGDAVKSVEMILH